MIPSGRRPIPLCSPRRGHTATLLDDGRVLLAGGDKPVSPERKEVCDFDDPCSLTSAEIVDPEALSSTLVAPMRGPREMHGAAAVPGGALVCGGMLSGGACIRTPGSVERFDVPTGTWSDMPRVPGMIAPSLTRLATGALLLVGGLGDSMSASTLAWAPTDSVWRPCADLLRARYLHAAELLADGRVLIAGGLGEAPDGTLESLASAALYDPQSDVWTETAPLHHARAEPTLTRLEDGSVLAVGGYYDLPMLGSAELFHPETMTWSKVGPLVHARAGHTTTALADGRALIVGGIGGTLDAMSPPIREAELFDPRTRAFEAALSFEPRDAHTATRLSDGRVLVAGGGPQTAEIWP